ncbi:MAG: hypothetical protein HGA90_06195 [Alphaproteobacteria bacterium]|nr:hypothetical protein [Alphaproteobacteria bacterium]
MFSWISVYRIMTAPRSSMVKGAPMHSDLENDRRRAHEYLEYARELAKAGRENESFVDLATSYISACPTPIDISHEEIERVRIDGYISGANLWLRLSSSFEYLEEGMRADTETGHSAGLFLSLRRARYCLMKLIKSGVYNPEKKRLYKNLPHITPERWHKLAGEHFCPALKILTKNGADKPALG